jgi:outer membrane immunogenic protein
MKRVALTVAVFFVAIAMANAGPEPLPSGKEMKQVTPPAPACFNWSGFYVGGFGGYKQSNADLDLTLSGSWTTVPQAVEFGEEEGSRDFDIDGGEAGGLIGYNFQWRCWVFVVEADGAYLWHRDSRDSGEILALNTSPFHIRNAFQTHYMFTVGPRIGYAFGRWLPYVTGGLAVGDLEFEQEVAFIGLGPADREGGHETDTNLGWELGGGLQYALTDHWSLRVQYNYIDLGDIDFDSVFQAGNGPGFSHHRAELTEHNASFALMYKF